MPAATVHIIHCDSPCSSAHVSDSPCRCERLRAGRSARRATSVASASPRPTLKLLLNHYISDGGLLRVERRFATSQVVQRLAPLSHFGTDGLQLLALSAHTQPGSSYRVGKYRFLHSIDAIVEARRLSPDINALSVLVRLIVQLLHVAQNAAVRFRKGQQLLLQLLGDGEEVSNGYISPAQCESPTQRKSPAILPPSPTSRFLHHFAMFP